MKRSFLFGAALLTGVQIFSQTVGFLFRVALSRRIGAEGMGLYQLVMPAYSVAMSVCAFGITVAVQRMSAARIERPRETVAVAGTAVRCFFALFAAVALPTLIFSDQISVYLLGDARTRMGLLILLPCIALTGIENIYKNYFYGIMEVRPPAIAEVTEQIFRAVCVLGLLRALNPVHLEYVVGVVVMGMTACEFVSAGMLLVFFKHRTRKLRAPKRQKTFREMVSIAAPVSLSSLAANLLGSVNTIIIPARLMVSGLGQRASLSAYGIAFGMTMPLVALPAVFVVPLSLTLMPRIAKAHAEGDRSACRRYIFRALTLAGALVIPACLLMIPFGADISRAVFDEPNAGEYVAPLAATQIFACFQYLSGSLLNGIGKQKNAAFNVIITDAAQLLITWFAVAQPDLRLDGYVAAIFVTTALCAAFNVIELLRRDDPVS